MKITTGVSLPFCDWTKKMITIISQSISESSFQLGLHLLQRIGAHSVHSEGKWMSDTQIPQTNQPTQVVYHHQPEAQRHWIYICQRVDLFAKRSSDNVRTMWPKLQQQQSYFQLPIVHCHNRLHFELDNRPLHLLDCWKIVEMLKKCWIHILCRNQNCSCLTQVRK